MAATTRIFQLRPTPIPIAATYTHSPTPASVHFFSSSSSSPPDSHSNSNTEPPPPPPPPPQPQPQSQSAFSAFFTDVKATLKQSQQRPQSQQSPRDTFSFVPSLPNQPTRPRINAGEEIRRNLSEFRRRTIPPPPRLEPNAFGSISAPTNSPQPISFADIYGKLNEASRGQGPTPVKPRSRLSFDAIQKSLRNMKVTHNPDDKNLRSNESMSPSYSRTSLKLFPTNQFAKPSSTVIGGSGTLPAFFAPEMRSKEDGDGSAKEMSWEFVKMYSPEELGKKLRLLRPEKKAGNKDWFSLEELNQRLVKLREMEENESASRTHLGLPFPFQDLRQGLQKLNTDDTTKLSQKFKLVALTTPDYMLSPPKEDLVVKYFHPDNMSASEKLKLELNKVRDEFKMSESDCGSARVQVAQLTTKIKHLSEVLHPKDKHSRKGLQAMVERRKKLLKYMRRTDWGSYCFVLSKLGLRDNPGYKH